MNIGLYLPIFGGWLRKAAEEEERDPTSDHVKDIALRAEEIGIDNLLQLTTILGELKKVKRLMDL